MFVSQNSHVSRSLANFSISEHVLVKFFLLYCDEKLGRIRRQLQCKLCGMKVEVE
jgi:hypothetical protein